MDLGKYTADKQGKYTAVDAVDHGAYEESWTFVGTTFSEMPTSSHYQPATTFIHH